MIAALLALCASGCTLITDSFLTNDFSGDAYAIDTDTSSGAVMVGLRQGSDDHEAVFDLLSMFTVKDPGPDAEPSLDLYADLTLLGARGPGGALDLPRARFPSSSLLSLHPCDDDACSVGPEAAPRAFDAIVGANVLAGDAVRLRLGASQLFIVADIGGSDHNRGLACDAVFPSPYRGGGTLVVAGTELSFANRRVTLQACLGANPTPDAAGAPRTPQQARGTDALFVASTGIGMSILGETAYARYRAGHPDAPALDALPAGAEFLPSGLVSGHLATLTNLDLVAASTSHARAPCRQVYAHHFFTQQIRADVEAAQQVETRCTHTGEDCPCDDPDDTFCSVPGFVEFAKPVTVLVISDADPTLQALRTELSPDQPEVDGLLGTDVLARAELDIDYPHDRLLGRCLTADGCATRPELASLDDFGIVAGCILRGPSPTMDPIGD